MVIEVLTTTEKKTITVTLMLHVIILYQVDIEISFTTMTAVMTLIENLMAYSWPEGKGKVRLPFPQMTYTDAMNFYGTDKPDTRFEMKVSVTQYIL